MASRKRRRFFFPPSTLSWPDDSIQPPSPPTLSTTSVSSSKFHTIRSNSSSSNHRDSKKTRGPLKNGPSSSSLSVPSLSSSQLLWTDRYRPSSCKELCVAPQKINVLKQWIQDFKRHHHHCRHHCHYPNSSTESTTTTTTTTTTADNDNSRSVGNYNRDNSITSHTAVAPPIPTAPPPKLCILVGGPGIGKSTMVRVIAEEMNLSVVEWNDTCGEYGGGWRASSSIDSGGGTNGSSHPSSSMDLFEEFLQSVSLPYNPVLEEKNSKKEDEGEDKDEEEMFVVKHRARTTVTSGTKKIGSMSSIVLLDELPNLHGHQYPMLPALQERFRHTMRQYVEKTWTPTILICSNVTEGKYKPEDLETYLDAELLYSPLVLILQMNPVTKAKMKSCIKDILKKEKLSTVYSDEWLEELHLKCGGDLRHAITNAQFHLSALKRSLGTRRNVKALTSEFMKQRGGSKQQGGNDGDDVKDVKLSTFHALGKLLYAKRIKVQENASCTDPRPPLEFDPERVLEDGDIGITGALSFIQHHAPDFFTDIQELSCAFDLLSDGTFLLDGRHDSETTTTSGGGSGSRFPWDHATSLCSRAIAHANKHPAPAKFRQLCAPKMYQVFRKRRENMIKFDQFCKRLSFREYHLTFDVNTRSSGHFATDYLPFLKRILPQLATTISVDGDDIYPISQKSYMGIHTTNNNDTKQEEHNQAIIEFEQQRAILEKDDIVDSSDSESDEEETIHDENVCNDQIHTTVKNNQIPPKVNDVIIID